MTLQEACSAFLGILDSVEAGVMTPEEALAEVEKLKKESIFKSDWTLEDFQKLRNNAISDLKDDDEFFDEFFDDEDIDDFVDEYLDEEDDE